MAKLKRSAHALYVDANMGKTPTKWYRIGTDIEELNVDLGADVEVTKNILDETSVNLNGYEPSIEASPYKANPDDEIYAPLKAAAMDRVMDEAHCKTKMLEVIIEDDTASSYDAWEQDCYLIPQSVGGDTSGFQIPFNLQPEGERTKGTATITNKVPSFTAGTVSP